MNRSSLARRAAFSLVELLVTLSIISLLLSLALLAVQAARDASRLAQCKSNLRQIGLGIQSHEATFQHFPGGGWGHVWAGLSDRGHDPNQPGGWIYRVLPYVEQQVLFDTAPTSTDVMTHNVNMSFAEKPVPIFSCPERPAHGMRTADPEVLYYRIASLNVCSSSDYAVNMGTRADDKYLYPGPASLDPQVVAQYPWPNPQYYNGLSFMRSQVRFADVTDGLSNVIAVGERWLPSDAVTGANNQTMLSGDTYDIMRFSLIPPARDGFANTFSEVIFGSRHNAGSNFALCDGSVRFLPYTIDPTVFPLLGSRNDGQPVTDIP